MSKRKFRTKRSPVISQNDIAYLNGLLSAFEDFSDGAWQAACESTIEADQRFAGRDPYDVWIAWIEATAERTG